MLRLRGWQATTGYTNASSSEPGCHQKSAIGQADGTLYSGDVHLGLQPRDFFWAWTDAQKVADSHSIVSLSPGGGSIDLTNATQVRGLHGYRVTLRVQYDPLLLRTTGLMGRTDGRGRLGMGQNTHSER